MSIATTDSTADSAAFQPNGIPLLHDATCQLLNSIKTCRLAAEAAANLGAIVALQEIEACAAGLRADN